MAKTFGDHPYVRPRHFALSQIGNTLAKTSRLARNRAKTARKHGRVMPRWTSSQRRLPLKLRKYAM